MILRFIVITPALISIVLPYHMLLRPLNVKYNQPVTHWLPWESHLMAQNHPREHIFAILIKFMTDFWWFLRFIVVTRALISIVQPYYMLLRPLNIKYNPPATHRLSWEAPLMAQFTRKSTFLSLRVSLCLIFVDEIYSSNMSINNINIATLLRVIKTSYN